MGNSELTKPSTSKYIINDKNLAKLEMNLLSYSGIPREKLQYYNVPVGKYEGEIIYMRTLVVDNTNSA